MRTVTRARTVTESAIERALTLEVTKRGGICWKWPASARAGVPDRIVVLGGRVVFVELKGPGGKPTAIQCVQHEALRAVGADVRVIDNSADIAALCDELTRG